MTPDPITAAFRSRVCDQIDLIPEGKDRFRIRTPFRFEDGDHFGIVLRRDNDRWILTDEASTLMHLSYWLDETELEGNRSAIIQKALSGFSVQDRDGEFVIPVDNDQFGDALYNFVQALSKVSDVSFLSREHVRSTFLDDLKAFLQANVPESRLSIDWTDPAHDKKGQYMVDFRVNNVPRPLFIYALTTETKIRDAMISLLMFEKWGVRFQSLGIYEDQERISRKTFSKFTDVSDKQFTNLEDNRDRTSAFLQRILEPS